MIDTWYVVHDGDTGEERQRYRDPDDAWAHKRELDRSGRRNHASVERVEEDVLDDDDPDRALVLRLAREGKGLRQ